MNYWQLETEEWETIPDNYDGAESITIRGRREYLEKSYSAELSCETYE